MTCPLRWAVLGTNRTAVAFAADLRVAGSGLVVFSSEEEFPFQSSGIDAVYVTNEVRAKCEIARNALEMKRSVLAEPPFENAAELLVDAANRNGSVFVEANWQRFQPQTAWIRKWAHTGEIGRVASIVLERGPDSDKQAEGRLFGPWTDGTAAGFDLHFLSLAAAIVGVPQGVRTMRASRCGNVVRELQLSYARGVHRRQVHCLLRTADRSRLTVVGTRGRVEVARIDAPGTFAVITLLPLHGQPVRIKFSYRRSSLSYQADEVARCRNTGSCESPLMRHHETVSVSKLVAELSAGGPAEDEEGQYRAWRTKPPVQVASLNAENEGLVVPPQVNRP